MESHNESKETMYLSSEEKQELLKAMEAHYHTYLRARSLTPYIDPTIIDKLSSGQARTCFIVPTAPLYEYMGYSCHIVFETGQFDTDEKCKQYQDIGHWINQSFLIELKCIVDTFITDWKKSPLKDDNYFKLLHICRNLFAHQAMIQRDIKKRELGRPGGQYAEAAADINQT